MKQHQLQIPDELNKKIILYKVQNNLKNKSEAIFQILNAQLNNEINEITSNGNSNQ